MKRLYALLVILIVIYIGINVGANNINLIGSDADAVASDNSTADGISLGSSTIPKLDNFTDKKINDTALKYSDSNYNMTINVNLLDNNQNISEIATNLINSGDYTSNQVIDQNGVITYFLYQESSESYNADIYFNKDNQNFMISGDKINYDNSDYFINHCKQIIDTIGSSNDSNGLSRW